MAQRLTEALVHFRLRGDRIQLLETLRSVAIALAARGDREPALRLVAGAAAVRVLPPVERTLLDRVLPGHAEARPRPGEDVEELMGFARKALAAVAQEVPAPPAASPAAPPTAVFRRDGDLWTLAYAGAEARVPHRKGLADIAVLLASPGREVHCLDLAAGGAAPAGQGAEEATHGRQGDLGDVVDARAREAYRARIEELQTEIDDAARANDPEREERARDELSALAEQLEAAYGLGGRVRRAGDPAERARTAVAWRVRHALGKLDDEHEPLARHLRNAVRMGTWCVYRPETPVRWQL